MNNVLFTMLFGIYLLGLLSAAFKDDYDGKDFIISLTFPPYTIYVAGKEIAYYIKIDSTRREQISECRYSLEEAGLPPEMRVKICNCLRKNSPEECSEKLQNSLKRD